ncbi:MAG TPA: hypothetical protein VK919_00400 [Solirubrobacterales bacterium]|nr:hypothetical protein [Solirubrobacterales bacterium]
MACVAVLSLLTASAAVAATGDLFPRGCVEDSGGSEGCARFAQGLAGSSSIEVSSDGRSVYVVGFDDSAIVHLRRNRRNGRLTPAGCVDDEGSAGCPRGVNGLDGAVDVAISADGRNVYTVSFRDDALLHFKRRPRSGHLRLANCIDDAGMAPVDDVCPVSADGMSGPSGIALSADGRSLYVAASVDSAIVRFQLNRGGKPFPRGCIEDDDKPFFDDCPIDRQGLAAASDVAVRPDGRSVYVASFNDDAVTWLRRNRRNGALRHRGCIDDNDPPSGPDECARSTDGLRSANSVTISPDGRYLYAGTTNELTIARFRLGRQGRPLPRGCVEDPNSAEVCQTMANGIGRAADFAIDSRGRSYYSAGVRAIAPFQRSPRSGALFGRPCIQDVGLPPTGTTCPRTTRGLGGVGALALSPDDRWLYAAAATDGAVVTFRRQR